MAILNVILLSLGSLIALFILTKLMGYRQMSEMSMFDYINGITIGSIAAEMATSLEKDWWLPLTAMIVYALAAIVLSYISVKSMAPEQEFLVANVIIDGHIMEKNLQHAGKDTQWLNKQMQIRNISNLGDILLATCDLNNQVTFYRKTHQEMTRDILD